MQRNWFLDFDDTLATGPTTWGLNHALPKLIRQHQLAFDGERYAQAVLVAQERFARSPDMFAVLNDLFDDQGWPHSLQTALVEDIQTRYRPELFADALPFLHQLVAEGQNVFILSNNPAAPELARQLGIEPYIRQFFTPKACPGALPKPDKSLWSYVLSSLPGVAVENSIVIGDDPWADGAFAEQWGLVCWIVDRGNRFGALYPKNNHDRVASLLDISTLSE